MANTLGVRIEGAKECRAALKAVDAELPRALKVGYKEIADKVATDARASFAARGGVAPKVASTVRALAQQSGASVAMGDSAHPYSMGAEFGGRRSPTTQQFQPWRGSGANAGYSLFPAIRTGRDHMEQQLGELFDTLMRKAFPD